MMCEGCENNERYSYSKLVREMSFTFYHHTDDNVDEEVQGVHGDDANVEMDVRRLRQFRKQVGDEGCRLSERWFYG